MIQFKAYSSKLLLILLGVVLQESVHAQYALAEGDFSSDKTAVRLLLLDGDKGVVAASVSVGMPPCSGAVAGIGSVRQRKIEFRPYESVPGGEKCRVALEFDSKWASLKISDNGECHQFHGASCSWDGDVVKRKRK